MSIEPRVAVLVDRWVELRDNGSPVTIEELCTEEPELASRVRRGIEALQAMQSFLETNVFDPGPTSGDSSHNTTGIVCSSPEFWQATAVYRRQRHYDQGGLGEIFTARQEELGRVVALKRIRTGRLHGPARQRFLREAAITAQLQHPGIVPIYGLGQDDHGPFYTMPLIQGQTLQQAIEEFHENGAPRRDPGPRSLKFRGLLQQFITVCNTMAYAHAQGYVHRDLKPSNIMIGRFGETVVMDWGLAKRFGSHEAASEEGRNAPSPSPSSDDFTATGQVLGTPQYMSPEQAKNEPLSPAADVFNLGLVLYAILTGKPAFEESRFRDADWLKVVREAAIVPPRSRDAGLPRALEAICLKALAVQPGDRYQTADALAGDVTRWLADEPVTAWREPVSIRLWRWGRRHRTGVAAAVVALAAGVIGLGAVTVIQARVSLRLKQARDNTAAALSATRKAQAETQRALATSVQSREQAEAVSQFLVETFRSPDPSEDGRQVKVADVLDRASARLDKGFGGSQATRGALLQALGLTYQGLGLFDTAATLHTKAVAVRQAVLGADHPDTLKSRNSLAVCYSRSGRLAEAVALSEQVLRLRKAALGPDHPDTLASRNNLAANYLDAGRTSEAIVLLQATLKSKEASLGPDHPDTLASRNNLANALAAAGRPAEAIAQHETTLKLRESSLGPDHFDTLVSRHNLATAYTSAGRVREAIALHEATLKLSETRLGSDHPFTLMIRNNLAASYLDAGRTSEAIVLHQATLKSRKVSLGPDHPATLESQYNLAVAYAEAGRLSEAVTLHEATLKLKESKLGPDHPDTLTSRTGLGNAYLDLGRLSEAMTLHEATLKLCESRSGPDHPDTLVSRFNLANAYWAAGRLCEAIALFEATVKGFDAKLGPDHPKTLFARENLAVAYAVAGRLPAAIALHESTLKLQESKLGPDHPDTLMSRKNLAAAYEEVGRCFEAEGLYREVVARRRKTVQPDSSLLAGDLSLLAQNLSAQSRWSEAEPLLRECLEIRDKMNPDDWRRYEAKSLLGGALLGQDRFADAEPLIVEGYEGMQARKTRIPVPDHSSIRDAALRVVHLYENWGRPGKANEWKDKVGMPDLPTEVFPPP
jgi:tetratricopeptide (TPR) repeat protein